MVVVEVGCNGLGSGVVVFFMFDIVGVDVRFCDVKYGNDI